jgi:hypothetical protein
MDIIQLPTLPSAMSLEEAWQVLVDTQRSALVTSGAEGALLIDAGDLLLGLEEGRHRLEELDGKPLPILSRSATSLAGATADALEGTVDDTSVDPFAGMATRESEALREHMLNRTPLGVRHQTLDARQRRLVKQLVGLLEDAGTPFALIDIVPGTAFMATGISALALLAGSPPTLCYCTDEFRHPGEPGARTGDPCRVDGTRIICR